MSGSIYGRGMFDSVIVGVGEDHGRSRDAIALAKALTHGPVTLVCAYPADARDMSRLGEEYFGGLYDHATECLQRARDEMGISADVLAVADPSPARALQHVAADRAAGLIVVGSAHHGRIGRLLAGDVGRGVLQSAPCPVAIAPAGFDQHRGELLRVAVGFDNSPEARAALDLAAVWADEHRTTVAAVLAWDLAPEAFSGIGEPAIAGPLAAEEQDHVTAAAEHAVAGIPHAEARIVRGSARHVLTEVAEEADLLIVGSRGWGPAHRVALGSTSDHLMHHCPVPVIVVPRPAAVATTGAESPAGQRSYAEGSA
jgi:nucleotide-binding universal stress UspA family protein